MELNIKQNKIYLCILICKFWIIFYFIEKTTYILVTYLDSVKSPSSKVRRCLTSFCLTVFVINLNSVTKRYVQVKDFLFVDEHFTLSKKEKSLFVF